MRWFGSHRVGYDVEHYADFALEWLSDRDAAENRVIFLGSDQRVGRGPTGGGSSLLFPPSNQSDSQTLGQVIPSFTTSDNSLTDDRTDW
jgi:hypothetical protein